MQTNKTKVLILHNYMTPYRFPLFEELSKNKDIDLTVFFMSKGAKNRKWKKLPRINFKYKVLPKIELSYFGKDFLAYIINYTFPFEFINGDYDVVVSAGWLDFASQAAFLLCKLTGKKFIIWSESTINEPSLIRTLTLPFVKFVVRNSDACIAIGTRSKEYLQLLGAKPEKIFIAFSTVDVDFFKKASRISVVERDRMRKEIGIRTSKVILYVGQFIERKGVIYLIKAFEKLKDEFSDVSLVLLGYGPLEAGFRSYIKTKDIRDVFFVGHKEVSDMPKMYAMTDVFVLPSLEETWGLVVNEAMASGLPIIATSKVGSSFDLIEQGRNGYVVRPQNYKEIYLALDKIIGNNQLATQYSYSSKKVIQHFTPKLASESFINAINSSFGK